MRAYMGTNSIQPCAALLRASSLGQFCHQARFSVLLFPNMQIPSPPPMCKVLLISVFPPDVVQAWASEIPSLNQLQLDAINDYGILRGEHLVASAPTSSGKTMLGELAAVRGALDRRRALFLMPLKALVNDKLRQFQRVYAPFGIRTIEATGETDDIGPLLRGQYDIALLTYEKFSAIALTHPYVLQQVGTIVVDEVQMIADAGTGANLEFLLTLLKMRRREGIEPQLIALSAVIGDTNGLERWLGGRLLRKVQRPVPLDEGIICYDGRFRYFDGDIRRASQRGPLHPALSRRGQASGLGHPSCSTTRERRQTGNRVPRNNRRDAPRGAISRRGLETSCSH